MAFMGNSIYPATYQPQYQQPQYVPQFQQPQYQPVMQTQPQMAVSGTVWITDEGEVEKYPVAPNNAVVLRELSGKHIYVKAADPTGKPSVELYERVVQEEPVDPKDVPYALKNDLAAVVNAVKELSGVVSAIKGDVDGIKGDVYGIAGKRKTTRKAEVTDDDE